MKDSLGRSVLKSTLICVISGGLAQGALAQTTSPTPVPQESGAEAAAPDAAQETPYVLEAIVLSGSTTPAAETGYLAPSTADRIPVDPLDAPKTLAAYTADRIADQGIRSNLELLQSTPGVDVTSNEGFTRIRGYYADATIDGIPAGTFIGRTTADLSPFEQVEIIKGPAALSLGNGGYGGVINYAFKRPLDAQAMKMRLGFGDPSAKLAVVDYSMAPLLDGRLRARFVVSRDERDSNKDPEGYERLSLYGVGEFDLTDRTTLRFSAWRQTNDTVQPFRTGLPTYSDGTLIDFDPDTTVTQDWAEYNFRSLWLNAELEHQISDRWNLKFSYRNGDSSHPTVRNLAGLCVGPDAVHSYEDSGIDRANPDGRQCYALSYWNDWNQQAIYDAAVSGSFDALGRSHGLTLGANHQRSWFRRAFGENVAGDGEFIVDVFNPDHHVIDRPSWEINDPWGAKGDPDELTTLFGQLNLQATERLSFPLGGRFTWSRSSDGEWVAKHEFTPSVAAVYKLNDDATLYAQYAEMFSPNTWNRGWNPDWTDGEEHAVDDGLLLPNETGTQIEIGAKASLFDDRALATAALFQITERNRPRADRDPDHPGANGDEFLTPTGETRSRGFELGLSGELRPGWKIGAAYAYIDAKYTKDDDLEGVRTGTSRHSANIWTDYAFQSGALEGLSLGVGAHYKSAFLGWPTDRQDTNRVRAPGYVVASARIGYRFNENVSAALNVDNLFDKAYYEIVDERGYGNYYGETRRISLTLDAEF